MTTFIPGRARANTLFPPFIRQNPNTTATRGQNPPRRITHQVPATLNPPPFTPNCFERTNFPLMVLRGYPFRWERERGDSLFLCKQAQPYVWSGHPP